MAPRDRSRDEAVVKALGARVREIRLEKGMTQEQVAEAAALHPTFISNIERGYRVPTVVTLLRLAKGLAVRPGELVDDLADR